MQKQVIQDEFSLRYYRWAMMDFQREIHDDFPLLKTVQGVASFRLLKIMQSLHREQQIKYASILVRRSHKRAVEIAGEKLTGKEENLWQQRSRLMIAPNISMHQNLYHQETIAKINQKKLRALVKSKLEPIMGDLYESEGNLLGYQVALNLNWNIDTSVRVGGSNKLEYFHIICASNQENFHLGPLAGIDLLRWFGIAGTAWDLMSEKDSENAVKSLSIICSHFIRVAPSLVEGLIPG